MDDANDKIYPSNSYSNNRKKFPAEKVGYPHNVGSSYNEDEDNEEEEYMHNGEDDEDDGDEDDDDDDDGGNGVQRISKDGYEYENKDESDNDNDEYGNLERHAKKRKLKTLLSSYEFAPRVPAAPSPPSASASAPKPSYGGRNPLTDWTEHETFILLDAWGERFLKHGRKSLRSEEWQAVAEKVSRESSIERTDTQCRNRLDTLKKKYKKEKVKLGGTGKPASEWIYFKKMDELLTPFPQQSGLSCGVDSGEFVFMNSKVYLNHSNGLDEMQDSPGNSESAAGREDESDGLPPQKTKNGRGRGNSTAASFKLLADSIQKFSEVYLKIENSKRQQMVELEKIRMDFHRDLELQKKQILERTQAEIEKIRQGDDDDNDVSG